MPKKINSLGEFKIRLLRASAEFRAEALIAVKLATQKVQADAESKFGTYQPAVGPFPAWNTLSDNYLKQKLKYGGEDPLIGHYGTSKKSFAYPLPLKNTIMSEVIGFKGYVGTNDPIGKYQEFGTSRGIPPRPFLRPALYENQDFIKELFRTAIVKTLSR